MNDELCITLVIMRRFKPEANDLAGEVIAIMPDLPANVGFAMSYMRVGQHGECSWPGILDVTTPEHFPSPDGIPCPDKDASARYDANALWLEMYHIGYRQHPGILTREMQRKARGLK